MKNSDHSHGWDGVERRAGGNNPRRVAVLISGESERKDRGESHSKRMHGNKIPQTPVPDGVAEL